MLRDRTVAFLCLMLTVLVWSTPITFFDTDFEGVDNDRMAWSCPRPIFAPLPASVDLDAVRAELAATSESPIESRHPQCRVLNGTQLVLGLLSLAGGIWKGRLWWLSTAGRGKKSSLASMPKLQVNPKACSTSC